MDHAADADQVADPVLCDVAADSGHAADDLMPRHARIQRARPFRTHLVQVGMAHTAIGNGNLHVVRARCAPCDLQGLQWEVARVGAVGFDGHGVLL